MSATNEGGDMTTVLRAALTGNVGFVILAMASLLSAAPPAVAGGRVAIPTSELELATTATSVVTAKFDAVNRHDIDQIVAAYAETATLTATDFCAARIGRNEVRRTYRDIFSAVPDVHAEIVELLADGNRVAVRVRLRGAVGGQPFELSLMNFFTVNDGLITRDDGIFDNGGRNCRP